MFSKKTCPMIGQAQNIGVIFLFVQKAAIKLPQNPV
jgi:hypothetical protein